MIPVCMISNVNGIRLVDLYATSSPISIVFQTPVIVKTEIPTGGVVSSFSVMGPLNELQLKPELCAMGGQVFSIVPRSEGSYGLQTMSTTAPAYVAGVLALMLEYQRTTASNILTGPQLVEKLMNYAKPVPVSNSDATIDNPIRQGAGLVQVVDALLGKTRVSPAKLSFNDTRHCHIPLTLNIFNDGDSTVTYTLSDQPAATIQPYDPTSTTYRPRTSVVYQTAGTPNPDVRFIFKPSTTITINAQGNAAVTVRLVLNSNFGQYRHQILGGYLLIKSDTADAPIVRVPYIVNAGHRDTLPLLDRENDFPKLDQTYDESNPYSLTNVGAKVSIIYRLLNPTPLFRAAVLLASDNSILGIIPDSDTLYQGRNDAVSTSSSSTQTWNGNYIDSNGQTLVVVPGQYVLEVRALKFFKTGNYPNDFDIWRSPIIVVTN